MRYDEIDWKTFLEIGKKQVGKPYRFGHEVDLNETDSDKIAAFDCSELVQYLYKRIGLYIEDGSYNQAKYVRAVPKDNVKVGDLGFKADPENGTIHHVGLYYGEGLVLEAKGKSWGVVLTPRSDYEASSHFLKWGRHKLIEDDSV